MPAKTIEMGECRLKHDREGDPGVVSSAASRIAAADTCAGLGAAADPGEERGAAVGATGDGLRRPSAWAPRHRRLRRGRPARRPRLLPEGGGGERHGAGGALAVEAGTWGSSGAGRRPPDAVRGKMEAALGADFSNVRVHVGPQAERIGAIAFTLGSDMYFAPGRYQPETDPWPAIARARIGACRPTARRPGAEPARAGARRRSGPRASKPRPTASASAPLHPFRFPVAYSGLRQGISAS